MKVTKNSYPKQLPLDVANPKHSYYHGFKYNCFPAGTLIRMGNGDEKPIEEIKLLDTVLTAEGNIKPVLQTMVKWYEGDIYKLRAWGHQHLKMTSNHPVLIKQIDGSRRKPFWRSPGYTPICELKKGDQVILPKFTPAGSSEIFPHEIVDIRGFTGMKDGTIKFGAAGKADVAALPQSIKLTPNFGRLLGLYAAEGEANSSKVRWNYGGHEMSLAEETCQLLTELGIKSKVQIRAAGNLWVTVYGKAWMLLFSALVPGTAKHGDKKLSPWLTDGPKDFMESILQGWVDGDGHHRRKMQQGVSVSHTLIMQMYDIAQAIGHKPTIRLSKPSMNRHAATRQLRWDMEYSTSEKRKANHLSTQQDTAVLRKIIAADPEPWQGWAYNLLVDGDNSYVAEGVAVRGCM